MTDNEKQARKKKRGENLKIKRDQRKTAQLLQAKEIAQQSAFLEAFSKLGTITKAAQAAGMQRDQHYTWMAEDPGYPSRFLSSLASWREGLVHEAFRRAVVGVDKPVIHQGKVSYVDVDPNDKSKGVRPLTVKEFSDQLLIRLLSANIPAYGLRDDPTLGGGDGGNADDERERLRAEIHRRIARQAALVGPKEGDRPPPDGSAGEPVL